MLPTSQSGSTELTEVPPRLTVVDTAGRLLTCALDGGDVAHLTWDWSQGRAPVRFAWPTWNTAGTRLACFAFEGAQGPGNVRVIDASGTEMWQLPAPEEAVPVYAAWNRAGDGLAVLWQTAETLILVKHRWPLGGEPAYLATGAPLFFAWSPDGQYLAAHIGESDEERLRSRVVLIDVAGGAERLLTTGHPAYFRCPVWWPEDPGVLCAGQRDDGSRVLQVVPIRGGEPRDLGLIGGQAAILAAPHGSRAALAVAPQGQGSAYERLILVDTSTGLWRPVSDSPCVAFWWAADGDALVTLDLDRHGDALVLTVRDARGEGARPCLRLLPSQEFLFLLTFFDQYALSHPIVAPDGSAVVVAGYEVEGTEPPAGRVPGIYVVPVSEEATPQRVAEGVFACFGAGPVGP